MLTVHLWRWWGVGPRMTAGGYSTMAGGHVSVTAAPRESPGPWRRVAQLGELVYLAGVVVTWWTLSPVP